MAAKNRSCLDNNFFIEPKSGPQCQNYAGLFRFEKRRCQVSSVYIFVTLEKGDKLVLKEPLRLPILLSYEFNLVQVHQFVSLGEPHRMSRYHCERLHKERFQC